VLLHVRRQSRDARALQRVRLLLSEDSGLQLLLTLRPSLFVVALAALVAGCPKPPNKPCLFIGDPAQPPQAVLIVTDGSGTSVEVHDGDQVPLERPPQGGQVTYAAARIKNMSSCGVMFRGRYRDPASGHELGFDGRNADLVVGADGWAQPDAHLLSNFANIAPCPDYDPMRDIQGTPALLEVAVSDQDGRKITVTQTVTPTCMQSDAQAQAQAVCVCECSRLPDGNTRHCGGED